MTVLFCIPTSNVWEFLFSICYCRWFWAIVIDGYWYCIVALICICLMTKDVEYLFTYFLAICISSLAILPCRSFAYFNKLGYLFIVVLRNVFPSLMSWLEFLVQCSIGVVREDILAVFSKLMATHSISITYDVSCRFIWRYHLLG